MNPNYEAFPLFSLPALPFEMVSMLMDPIDILNISCCSSTTSDILRANKIRNSVATCFVYLRPKKPQITFVFRGNKRDLKWQFDPTEKCTKNHIREEKIINGYVFKTCYEKKTPHEVICHNENIAEGFPIILEHLLTLFSIPIQLIIEPNLGELKNILSFPGLAECAELVLTKGYQKLQFEQDELEVISKKIEVKRKFSIEVDSGLLRFPQVFKVDHVSLHNAKWLNRSDLLSLNCITAKFKRHNFTTRDIEEFALKWKSSPIAPKLQRLEIGWNPQIELRFRKLQTKKWDRRKRSKRCTKTKWFYSGTYDFSAAFDFEREDGLLASIGVVEDYNSCVLIFHVWHELFPTKPEQERLQKKLDNLRKTLPEINRVYGIGSAGERVLTNPELTSDEFLELLNVFYGHRTAQSGKTVQSEAWFNFHKQIYSAIRELEVFV